MRRILLALLLFMLPSLAEAQIQCLGPTCPIAFASSNISTGSANVQAVSTTSGQFSLQTGNSINFVPGFSNSGAMTVNVDGTGAVAVHLNGAAVPANTLLANQAAILIYDGVAFDVPSPQVGGTSALPSGDIWVGNGSGIATAVAPSGDLTMTNAGAFTIGANKVTLPDIAQIGTNTVLGNATSGTANVTALAVGSCSATADALIWTTNTGFGCNTAIDAATLLTKTWASPAAIGTGTPAAGTFTTVTANTSVTTPIVTTTSGNLLITPAGLIAQIRGGGRSQLSLFNTSAGADLGNWDIGAFGDFEIRTVNDAYSSAEVAYTISRGPTLAHTQHTFYTDTSAGAPVQQLSITAGVSVGTTVAGTETGELGFTKISPSGSAPGAGTLKISAVAGTNAGTCKIIAYAGTSTTPVTVIDNVGSGC